MFGNDFAGLEIHLISIRPLSWTMTLLIWRKISLSNLYKTFGKMTSQLITKNLEPHISWQFEDLNGGPKQLKCKTSSLLLACAFIQDCHLNSLKNLFSFLFSGKYSKQVNQFYQVQEKLKSRIWMLYCINSILKLKSDCSLQYILEAAVIAVLCMDKIVKSKNQGIACIRRNSTL